MYEEIQKIAYENALGMPLYQPKEVRYAELGEGLDVQPYASWRGKL